MTQELLRIEVNMNCLCKRCGKRLADKVCDFNRLTRIWEQDFVDLLMEKPHKADVAVRAYITGSAKLKADLAPVAQSLPYSDP